MCYPDKGEYAYLYDYEEEQECVEDANTEMAVSSDGSNPMIPTEIPVNETHFLLNTPLL